MPPFAPQGPGGGGATAMTGWSRPRSIASTPRCDNPDAARILCFTNRRLDRLVPHARRAIHGEMADQMAVLPGEVLITRTAVMAPASRDGGETGEEPDLVLGSNREVVVEDVTPERCDLAEFGLAGHAAIGWPGSPVIETLNARVRSGELELNLRLQPPSGSQARQQLDALMKRLASRRAMPASAADGRCGGSISWFAMPSRRWGLRLCSRCIAARAAVSVRSSSPTMCSAGPISVGNLCTWRSVVPERGLDGRSRARTAGWTTALGRGDAHALPSQVDPQAEAERPPPVRLEQRARDSPAAESPCREMITAQRASRNRLAPTVNARGPPPPARWAARTAPRRADLAKAPDHRGCLTDGAAAAGTWPRTGQCPWSSPVAHCLPWLI